MDASTPPRLILLPAGVGQPKSLPVAGFETYYFARWLPDGKRIFFNANPAGRAIRCHVLDLAGGAPRAIGPEGASCRASSPDGKLLALTAADQSLSLYPVDGGSPARPVPGWPAGATPIQWSADGAALFYALSSDIPGEIHRFDLATGRSQVWQQLAPGDLGGVQTITSPVITPDGHVYAYTFARLLGDVADSFGRSGIKFGSTILRHFVILAGSLLQFLRSFARTVDTFSRGIGNVTAQFLA